MLRITRRADARVTLKLEGALREPWVAELRVAATAERAAPVALDLADVQFVDEAGLALLRELLGDGRVTLAACSNFVAELLQRVTR